MDNFFFTIPNLEKDPDPGSGSGSGSELPDFQFEDPEHGFFISNFFHFHSSFFAVSVRILIIRVSDLYPLHAYGTSYSNLDPDPG